jgi:hypothetical protein
MKAHRLLTYALFTATVLFAATQSAGAAPVTEASALKRVFTSDEIDSGWIAQNDDTSTSASVLQLIIGGLKLAYGPYRDELELQPHEYQVRLAHGVCHAHIELDDRGRIRSIKITNPESK